jgi:hypothetical protein
MENIFSISSLLNSAIFSYLALGLFIILIIIIGYLYLQLKKKDNYIQLIFDKLHIQDPEIKKEELSNILSKLQIVELTKIVTKDKFFNDNILNYIFKDTKDKKLFLHYTQEKTIADKVLKEGFQFRYSFYKTAYKITLDRLDLIYKHSRSKYFGKNVLILSISTKIYNYYTEELKKISPPETFVEQILTEVLPFHDENNDVVYALSNKFVKGYFNYETDEMTDNPEFNPNYDCDNFRKNLARLRDAYSKKR